LSYADGQYIFDTDLNKIVSAFKRNGVFNGWNVNPGTSSLSVVVSVGYGKVGNERKRTYSPSTITLPDNTSTYPRRDLIIIDSYGNPSYIEGIPQAIDPAGSETISPYGSHCRSPKMPGIPSNAIVLAEVWVPSNFSSTFSSDYIRDLRVFTMPSYDAVIDPLEYPGTNVFQQLQNALNDVPSSGAMVLVPNCTITGSNLTIPSNVSLIGAGRGSCLKLDTSSNLISISNQSDIYISNIFFDGSGFSANLIRYSGDGSRISIIGNKFTNFSQPAIYIVPNSSLSFVTTSYNEFFDGNNAAVIYFGAFNIYSSEITHNKLYNLTDNGKIGAKQCDGLLIADNQIRSCRAPNTANIVLRGGKKVVVSRNQIIDCPSSAPAIGLEEGAVHPFSDYIIIDSNMVINQTGNGIAPVFGDGSASTFSFVIRNNFFRGNSSIDIDTTGWTTPVEVYFNQVETPSDLSIKPSDIAYGNRIWKGERIVRGELFSFSGSQQSVSPNSTVTVQRLRIPANTNFRVYAKWGDADVSNSNLSFLRLYNSTNSSTIDNTDLYTLSFSHGSPLTSTIVSSICLLYLQYVNLDTSAHSISGGYLISIT